MANKRKFTPELDTEGPTISSKHLKLIPFPNYEPDMDVSMSDEASQPMGMHIDIPTQWDQHNTRLPSDASSLSASSDSSYDSPAYPTFDLYPLPFFSNDGSVNPNSHSYAHYSSSSSSASSPTSTVPKTPVGLLQPSSGFSHHGANCSQIPKLRVACSAGTSGQRTMWSFCEQCGAISMVDSD